VDGRGRTPKGAALSSPQQVQVSIGTEQMIPHESHSDQLQEWVSLDPAAAPLRAFSFRLRRVSRLSASFLTAEFLFMDRSFSGLRTARASRILKV
jgi:hypothetical protein